jgi:hypothetical protein
VLGAQRALAVFETDRGPRELPAWRVWIDGMADPVSVLDPALSREAAGPQGIDGALGTDMRATLDAGGCVLVVEFLGGPPQFTDYPRAVVVETSTAVAVIPVPYELVEGDRLLYAQRREVTVHLGEPLGARVALDCRTGCPITVDTEPAPLTAQPVARHPTKP